MHSLQLSWPQEAISQALSPFWPEFVVEAVPQLDSTNTALLERARSGHTMPVLLVTEKQTAGRGRMGRQWHNTQPAGGMLAFSLGLPLPACDLSGLSLVVACSVVNSLDAQQRHGLRIKWPNDLWLGGSKLGGILVEICSQGAQRYAVIGVGINITEPLPLPPAAANQPTQQPPAWVQQFAPQASAPDVLALVAAPLAAAVHQFTQRGFTPWQSRFMARDALAGQAVRLSDGDTGVVQGVNAQGALLLQTARGVRTVLSDEISVRPQGLC